MNVSRRIPLLILFSLLLPSTGLAASYEQVSTHSPSYHPVYVAQSLPPMQGSGYQNQNHSNYGNGGYTDPQYTQQPQYTQPYSQGYPSQQTPLQGYVVTAPPGTMVSAMITSPVSSEYARVGDRFTATLGSPLASGANVLLPAGSQMEGQVVMARPAGRTGRNGELDVRFTSAILPNGQRVPLSARIQTEDGTGILKGGTMKGRLGRAALNTGIGAGLGAALGTAMGPLSGGEVGRGAIYGTAVGAGVGALSAAWKKGKPAVIESGAPVNIVLDQPLTTSPAGPDTNTYPQQYQQSPQYSNPYGGQTNPQPYNFYGGQ